MSIGRMMTNLERMRTNTPLAAVCRFLAVVCWSVTLGSVDSAVAKGVTTLTVTDNGASSASVAAGATFELDVDLSGLATELAVSAAFEVTFSVDGLSYTSYVWTAPFTTGAGDDLSNPSLASLPTTIVDTSFGGVGSAIDVHFDNFASAGGASNGTIVTLSLQVPAMFPSPATITIDVVPGDFVFNNSPFAQTPAAGPSFTLSVIGGALLDVTVDLEGVDTAVSRNVTFVTTDCLGAMIETQIVAMNLDATGVGTTTLTLANTDADWISADEGHTLRRLIPLGPPFPASVSFTGADRLLAGDFNGDGLVDVEDLSVLASNWSTPGDAADVNGDGVQDTVDFTAVLVNFFQLSDAIDGCP